MCTQVGLLVVDLVWPELVIFLDGSTYHNFYWTLGEISRFVKNNTMSYNKTDKCLEFMKYNPIINYAQSIISIYQCCRESRFTNLRIAESEHYELRIHESRIAE